LIIAPNHKCRKFIHKFLKETYSNALIKGIDVLEGCRRVFVRQRSTLGFLPVGREELKASHNAAMCNWKTI
jgi:hypothetical protein